MNNVSIEPVTLTGRAAQLVPLEERHADDLAAVADPEIFRYHFPPDELTAEGFRQQMRRIHSLGRTWLPFAIIEQATNRAVGVTCFLDIRPEHRGLEIGFTWLARRMQGTPINPECKFLLLRHAFESLEFLRVQLKTDGRNLQSQRAIEKLGAVKEGVLRKHMLLPDGFCRDTVMYSVTDEDWPNMRQRLIERLGYEL